jgi:nucleolar protein 56
MVYYILFESSCGFALFERIDSEEVAELTPKIQKAYQSFKRFSKIVNYKTFLPFTSPDNGLENINDISEGILNPFLKNFLLSNFPKGKGSNVLGVVDKDIAVAIETDLGIKTDFGTHVAELCRCIRLHFDTYLASANPDVFKSGYVLTGQKGLSHAYSRAKIKFNVNRADNMIIQAICLLDQIDKDINTLCMRIKEWYSWHFPEMGRIVKDNEQFTKIAYLIKDKKDIQESHIPGIEEIVGDPEIAKSVYKAAKSSTGYDISQFDIKCIENFAVRVISMIQYRRDLSDYLTKKMHDIAPNLSSLIGEIVGARLINKAGSLITLAKYPASTIQILGAEKALFRALKSRKGNTPKYGLIFNSSFINRAKNRDKGRISRYLANKCAIASRIDAFYDFSTTAFGTILHDQVEERLGYYESGKAPEKNNDIMQKAIDLAEGDRPNEKQETGKSDGEEKKSKKRKRTSEKNVKKEVENVEMEDVATEPVESSKKKKRKSSKKIKS